MPWEKSFDVDEALTRAMNAFWAHGFEATSMQDLVDATGVNRASLYATYGDKRAIFLAALHKYDSEVRRRLLYALAKAPSPTAAIGAVFDRFIAQSGVEGGNWGCFLTNTALELAAHDPEIAGVVAKSQAEIETFLLDQIAWGQATGEFSKEKDARPLARQTLASLLGLLVLVRSRPEPDLLNSIRDSALQALR